MVAATSAKDGPPYTVRLTSSAWIEVLPGHDDALHFEPPSPILTKMMGTDGRQLSAEGYSTGPVVRIKAGSPETAAQDILGQIGRQTGLHLRAAVDSRMKALAPIALVHGVSETAVVTVLLTPGSGDSYAISVSYVIDARRPGAIDGTAAGIANLAEQEAQMRKMFGDSTATLLPERLTKTEIQDERAMADYFHGAMQFFARDKDKSVPVLVLMLRRHDDYTVAFYREHETAWVRIGDPAAVTDAKQVYLANVPAKSGTATNGIRADLRAGGTVYVYLEDGGVVKRKAD